VSAIPSVTASSKPLIVVLRVLAWLLLLATLVWGGWHVQRFAQHNGASLVFRGPLDGQEGTLLYEARLILRGEPLYQPLRLDRVVGAPYPPVHAYTLAAAEVVAHGANPPRTADEGHFFFAGRLISITGIVGAAVLIGLVAWRLGAGPIAVLLAPCFYLATAPAQLWATRIKPDPLGLLFTSAGLLLVALSLGRSTEGSAIRDRGSGSGDQDLGVGKTTTESRSPIPNGYRRSSESWLVVAAVCFALAYFTKQTQIAAPLATMVLLLLTPAAGTGWHWRTLLQRWHRLIVFGLSYVGLVGSAWLLLDWSTAGQFSFHVWGLHPPSWWEARRFWRYSGLLIPGWPLFGLQGLSKVQSFALETENVLVFGGYSRQKPIHVLPGAAQPRHMPPQRATLLKPWQPHQLLAVG
jgi:hypothetical protein